jgi:hypothetical protein
MNRALRGQYLNSSFGETVNQRRCMGFPPDSLLRCAASRNAKIAIVSSFETGGLGPDAQSREHRRAATTGLLSNGW